MAIITAKIAELVTSTQVAFNAGSDAGVQKGDKVTLHRDVTITDPETQEILGRVRVPKLGLTVSLVNERFCVAYVTDPAGSGSGMIISTAFYGSKKVTTNATEALTSDTVLVKIGEDAEIHISDENDTEE